jgi:hypothetical protein
MRKTTFVSLLLPLLALSRLTAAEQANDILTPDQKAALAAVDVRLAGVEALAAKIDDPNYKTEVAKQIEDLKKRRRALEQNFDPGLYEVLMHAVISRYQVIALWLKPAPLPAPAPPARATIEKAETGNRASTTSPIYGRCRLAKAPSDFHCFAASGSIASRAAWRRNTATRRHRAHLPRPRLAAELHRVPA